MQSISKCTHEERKYTEEESIVFIKMISQTHGSLSAMSLMVFNGIVGLVTDGPGGRSGRG